jgi:NAD(P)-dependent dehydrogenase (short-subunit alcohol dehydrogenase family)
MNLQRSIVVTGASTGIGWGITKVLLANGFQVFGSVRREEDARRLREQFGTGFVPTLMEITDEAAVRRAAEEVSERLAGTTLFGLVNNAGIAVPGPLLYQPLDQFRRQLEVNVTGQLVVTQAFAPLLGTDPNRSGDPGRIVNITSTSGKIGSPFLGAYTASKHALEGLSESLRRELTPFGIKTVIVAPGPVRTAIWDKAEQEDLSPYRDTVYGSALENFRRYSVDAGRKGLPPERLGEVVLVALTTARPKTRYVAVPRRLTDWTIPSLLPASLIDSVIEKQMGLKRLPQQKR